MASVLSVRAGYEPQPMFDPRAFPVYLVVAAEALLTVGLMVGLRFRIETMSSFKPLPGAALLLVCGLLARRIGHAKIGTICEALALIFVHAATSLTIVMMLTALALPFADNQLAAIDGLLGFNAPAFVAAVGNNPFIVRPLAWAYASLGWQIVPIIVVLVGGGLCTRAWRTIAAMMISLAITVAIYPFVPAAGTLVHFGIQPADYPMISGGAWKFAQVIELIRDGGVRTLNDSLIAGLVSFPSFHTAAAVIFAWALWPVRAVRYPALILNALVIAASLLFGAHYLVDLIGGGIVAALSIWASTLWKQRDNELTS